MNFAGLLLACATCFGDPNSAQTRGQNAAIFTLLAVTGFVLAGFIVLIIHLARRARQSQLPQAG
jgi:hypothetical protein